MRLNLALGGLLLAATSSASLSATDPFCQQQVNVASIPNPVVFVTQFPLFQDFGNIASTFLNHEGSLTSSGRGGDLYIRYPDGKLCNLTREAGFGMTGFQGSSAIAVRDPEVSFDGTRVIFSMVVGGPSAQYDANEYYWQIYEVTGLQDGQPVSIQKVANQPANYNNIMPTYGSDGRIIFVSDRPISGQRHHYPQHDEYESTPIVTGLWSLAPASGELSLLEHSPSGSFDPVVDSFGRVIFSRWDHLQQDQQSDGDDRGLSNHGTFDFSDESASAQRTQNKVEDFPEPLRNSNRLNGTNINGLRMNHFFPWMINQDGTGEETLNHIGRHELHAYFTPMFNDDSNLRDFTPGNRSNDNAVLNFFHLREDPTQPGRYYAIDAPEFQTHTSGLIMAIDGHPTTNADDMQIEYITHPITFEAPENAGPEHSGHYRNPLPLTDGGLLASHTFVTGVDSNLGTALAPRPRYEFRIRRLTDAGNGYQQADSPLTNGIHVSISYWNPDQLLTFTGEMWELSPVEVVSRMTPPTTTEAPLHAPEQAVVDSTGADLETLRRLLRENELALMIVRDITSRDDADSQQPFNLAVPGGITAIPTGGTVYEAAALQMFQADMVRGRGGVNNPRPGRRPLARPMHDPAAQQFNPAPSALGAGAFDIKSDGSVAMFVPTRRAMAWQVLDGNGEAVLRERYWITFQPGEIRVCDGCHGVNKTNHMGDGPSQNSADAFAEILGQLENYMPLFSSSFE